MRLDPQVVRQQISNLLVMYPELAEDEVLRMDMIEAETDAKDFLRGLVNYMAETEEKLVGIEKRREKLMSRKSRLEQRYDSLKALAHKIMDAGNLRKVELEEATLSIRNTPPSIVITDEKLVPDTLCKFTRTPSKTMIKEKMQAGEKISGAEWSNGGQSLAVRDR